MHPRRAPIARPDCSRQRFGRGSRRACGRGGIVRRRRSTGGTHRPIGRITNAGSLFYATADTTDRCCPQPGTADATTRAARHCHRTRCGRVCNRVRRRRQRHPQQHDGPHRELRHGQGAPPPISIMTRSRWQRMRRSPFATPIWTPVSMQSGTCRLKTIGSKCRTSTPLRWTTAPTRPGCHRAVRLVRHSAGATGCAHGACPSSCVVLARGLATRRRHCYAPW